MSEPLLARTLLVPSRLRRRLQQVAATLTLLAAGLLAWAASAQPDFMSPAFLLLAAAFIVTLCVGGLLLRGLRPRRMTTELAIAADGTITVSRPAPQVTPGPQQERRIVVRPVALTWASVVLRGSGQSVVVWRDSLPAEGFRRLSAVARWRVDRSSAPDDGGSDLQQRAA